MKKRIRPNPVSNSASQLSDELIKYLSRPDCRPAKLGRLACEFKLDGQDKELLSDVIQGLVKAGKVMELENQRYALKESLDLLSGTISLLRSGAAFVKDPDTDREVFIKEGKTGTALSGDQVLVKINQGPSRDPKRKGDAGAVIRVLDRRRVTVVGTLKKMRGNFYVEPINASISQDLVIRDPREAKIGDRVLVKLVEWDSQQSDPIGEIIEVIGPSSDATFDTESIIKAYDLETEFSKLALQQAEREEIKDADLEGRLDLRKKFIFTIDPESACDFDDAISMEKLENGKWEVGVHIADVSHFVSFNSDLDKDAYKRGTSVYLPDKVIPMLPEQISNGLCSLNPHVDRLTFSAILVIEEDGTLIEWRFAKSVIHSSLRLTYEQAMEAIQPPAENSSEKTELDAEMVHQIQLASKLSQNIRKQRFRNGALNMDIPEMRFVIGKDGHIENAEPVVNDKSHQLIEELMLLANEAVCRELCLRGVPLIHRIHEEPFEEKLAEIREELQLFGIQTGDLSQRLNLARVLDRIQSMPEANAWNTKILKAMKRAEYSEKRLGHYGLAKDYYCHFTSPIRRYPDLVVHRMLQAFLTGEKWPYTKTKLAVIAKHCSECETKAANAERDVVEIKKIRFLQEQLRTGNVQDYQAVVLQIHNFGLIIDVPDVLTSGMIRVADLRDDYYDLNPGRMELVGRRTNRTFTLGMTLTVNIFNINEERRFLDFVPIELDPIRNKKGKHTKRRGKKSQREPIQGKTDRKRNKFRHKPKNNGIQSRQKRKF